MNIFTLQSMEVCISSTTNTAEYNLKKEKEAENLMQPDVVVLCCIKKWIILFNKVKVWNDIFIIKLKVSKLDFNARN